MVNDVDGATTIEYSVEIAHSCDEGLVVLPVAGPIGTPGSVARLHAPTERKSIAWSAARLGGAPKVPSWRSFIQNNNANVIFLGGQRSAVIPVPVIGGRWFIIAGQYDYALRVAEGLDSEFKLGKMPWETHGVNENDIPAIFFDPLAILSASPGGRVGGGVLVAQ